MKSISDRIIDPLIAPVMDKYDIPEWARSYIREYIRANLRRNPVGAIKKGISFVETGRRKGVVTKSSVRLPNGTEFSIESVAKILSLFLYGEERISRIEGAWARDRTGAAEGYCDYFETASELSSRHARAIHNLLQGMGRKRGEPSQEVVAVFDYIESLKSWPERIVATEIVLRYSYSVFGAVFYRSFYASSTEFMRSFGKAFKVSEAAKWGYEKALGVLRDGAISDDPLYNLARELLQRVFHSINAEMYIAKEADAELEVALLRNISVEYPLHIIKTVRPGFELERKLWNIKRQ